MCELLHTSAVVQKMQRGQKNPWNVRGPGQARRLLRACELVTVGVGVLSNLFFFLLKEPSSVLKGGEQGCQRQLVNEVLGPLVTEFALKLGREGATPTQPGFNASLLGCI